MGDLEGGKLIVNHDGCGLSAVRRQTQFGEVLSLLLGVGPHLRHALVLLPVFLAAIAALAADAALLSAAERQVIDDAAAHLSAVAEGNDADAIEEAIKNVDKQTQDFAARRMDKSVRVALKGQSVDEV